MMSSKLILFFCFYLLLLDNSLGQQSLLEQAANQKLLKKALDFGATFGGEVGELGSHWKQLLFELVEAKRKVGLGKYQLARFNDSATEEVGLDIKYSYADKVAELVAIRTQDIGTTQKYVDDLEILKDEIALTMIVKMEELEEQLKQTNVRKKVKEAKENGITDTDIKEILFADYFDSGLSLIGAAASTADLLLSSFLNGMLSILNGKYFEKLGIIEYGIGNPVENDHPLAGGDDNSIEYVVPGGAAGGGGGSGGAPGGGGGSGGFPGGPPTDPPTGPPSVVDLPDDSHEQEGDDKDKKKVKDPDKELADFFQANYDRIDLGEAFKLEDRPFENGEFNAAELAEAEHIVQVHMDPIIRELVRFERNISRLEEDERNVYETDPLSQAPDDLSEEERLALSHRRIEHFQGLLNRTREIAVRFEAIRNRITPRLVLMQHNYEHYENIVTGRFNLTPQPQELEEFNDLSNKTDRMRFVVSFVGLDTFNDIVDRYNTIHSIIGRIWKAGREIRKLEKKNIKSQNNHQSTE